MIDPYDNKHWGKPEGRTRIGARVLFQLHHMNQPECGVITSLQSAPHYIHVQFREEENGKACRPEDLYWPPDMINRS